ncbi:MAG: membrane protein insertion efficiency factor YidD [Flavobacteriales bacterium]
MLSRLFILLVRIYQVLLSPLLGAQCRHEPSCSHYAVAAFKEWGAFKGLWLSIVRVLKCRPRGTWGYDPVPKNKK